MGHFILKGKYKGELGRFFFPLVSDCASPKASPAHSWEVPASRGGFMSPPGLFSSSSLSWSSVAICIFKYFGSRGRNVEVNGVLTVSATNGKSVCLLVLMVGCKAIWGGCAYSLQGLWAPRCRLQHWGWYPDEQSLSSSVFVTRGH